MARKAVGTVEWVPAKGDETKGRFRYRISLTDGGRPWIEEPPGPKSPQAERTVRERAAARTEQARAEGLRSEDFGLKPRGPRKGTHATPLPATGETSDQFFGRVMRHAKELGQTDTGVKATRWNKWISPTVGNKALADVTRDDVEDVRDKLDAAIEAWKKAGAIASRAGEAISGKTAMNIWSALTSTMKAATSSKRRDLRVLDGKPNPCTGVEPPGDRDSRKVRRKTFLYPREAASLLAHPLVPIEWREVYAVSLYLYARPGELRVLTCEDVDADAAHVSITKAWDYPAGKVKTPKTRNGVRRIPIEPALAPLLARMMKGKKRDALLLPILDAFGEDHLAEQFRKHLQIARVNRTELHESTATHVQANFRSCRDSGITWLAMSGLDVAKIVRRAGHDDVQTSMSYVKLAEDLGGTLGAPFGPLPTSLVDGESSGQSSGGPGTPTFAGNSRAGEGIRTLDVHLGKVALYH
jgi:integrase